MDECPKNETEFEAAAKRRNCTEDTRYLCAPDKNLTSLIEFCTDQKKSLYGKGGVALRFIMSLKLQFHFEVMQDDIDQNKKKSNNSYYICTCIFVSQPRVSSWVFLC